VVPGLHLLRHWVRPGVVPGLASVLWFVAGRGVESRVLAGLGEVLGPRPHALLALALEPPGGGAPGRARLLVRTLPAALAARRALRRARPDVLLGLGGYTVLPAVLAAKSLGVPVVLLEINAVPGRATRWLAPLAREVVHAWPPHDALGPRQRVLGPPLDPALLARGRAPAGQRAARERLGMPAGSPCLVVLGGSQGAAGINRFVAAAAPDLVAAGIGVLHQVGPGRRAEGASPASPFAAAGGAYRAVEYLEDVPLALAAATLVLCRGGASTLAEIGAFGRAAIVVPYPHHADRHQEANARRLGAGVRVVPEAALDGAFVPELAALLGPAGDAERAAMERALEGSVPRDGAERLIERLAEIAGKPAGA